MSQRFLALKLLALAFAACAFPAAAADTADAAAMHRNYAAYLYDIGKPDAALLVLKSKSIVTGPLAARLYIKAGLSQPAADALQKWANKKAAIPAWLALAKAQYKAGKWHEAEHSLAQTPTFLAPAYDRQKVSLLGRSLLRQNRNDKAARVLNAAASRRPLTGVDKYNLGVAWLRAGEHARGAGVLSALGHDKGGDAYTQALADQANLALGYWFLRHQRGGLARAAFERIHLHGPLAESAKVGMGWAELAAGDGVQRLAVTHPGPCAAPQPRHWGQTGGLAAALPRPCSSAQAAFGDTVLTGKPAHTAPQEAMHRAAVAWSSATETQNLSPVVQEALIALPFALAQAGEPARARSAYHNAIARLEPYVARRASQIAGLKAAAIGNDDDAFVRASDWSLQPNEVTRLRALQRQMTQVSAAAQGRLQKANEQAQPSRYRQILATVLTQLHKRAPRGRTYAAPTATQRGVLLLALNSEHTAAAVTDRRATLINTLRRLAHRAKDLEKQLASARRQRQLEIVNASYAFSQARLRAAYAGLADLRD